MNLPEGKTWDLTKGPKVSVIIPNWNGKKFLKTCLDSLETQTFRDFKAILVDNGSSDGSVEFLRENYPEVEIIALDKNYGFAKGNNIGIEETLKDKDVKYIALLNNDTKVEPDWLKELVKVAELDGQIGSCQPKVLSLDDPKIIDAIGIRITKNGKAIQIGYETEDRGQHNQVKEVFGACAGSALYKREMFDQIGLFDEDFFAYFEDVDLVLRARLAGWKCMYVPKAIVYHVHSATYGKDSPFKGYFLTRNQYYYIIKNLPINIVLRFFLIMQARNIRTILGIIKGVILKDVKGIRLRGSYLKGNFDAIKNIPKMFKKRKKILSARLISDEELEKWFK